MSYITDVVVLVVHAPDEAKAALVAPLPFDSARGQFLTPVDTETAGGTKVFCSDLYAAALNHVSADALEEWFKGLPWGNYSRAYLTWDTEMQFGGMVRIGDDENY